MFLDDSKIGQKGQQQEESGKGRGKGREKKEVRGQRTQRESLLFFVIVRLGGRFAIEKTVVHQEEDSALRAYMNSGKKKKKKIKGSFDPLQRERQRTSKQNNNLLHFALL